MLDGHSLYASRDYRALNDGEVDLVLCDCVWRTHLSLSTHKIITKQPSFGSRLTLEGRVDHDDRCDARYMID